MRQAAAESRNSIETRSTLRLQHAWISNVAAKLTTRKIVVTLWLAAVVNFALLLSRLPARENKVDFSLYYTAATALRTNINPYTKNLHPLGRTLGLNLSTQSHIPYTPAFLIAFEPLTLLSPKVAYWTWFALSLAALCGSMIFLLRRVGIRASALGAFMLLYPPLAWHFMFAQSQLLILLLLCAMLYSLETDNHFVAGLSLGIAGALRAFPLAILGYLLFTRRWRPILWTAFTLLIIGAATLASLGWRTCFDFQHGAHYALGYQYLSLPTSISLCGFISHFFWNVSGPNLGQRLEIFRYLTIGAAEFLVLLLSARATLSSSGSRSFSLWVVVAIISSPIAWFHYQVLLFILFAEVAAAANRRACSARAIWAAIASYASAFIVNGVMLGGFVVVYSTFYRWFGQLYFLSPLLAYLSAYWLAVDYPAVAVSDTAGREPELLSTAQA